MECERDGTSLAIYAPDEATADLLELLCKTWPGADVQPTTDLGDLTEYNAMRARLTAQRDAFQDRIDLVDTNIDPDARAKIDGLLAARDIVNAVMRATQRDTNPQ